MDKMRGRAEALPLSRVGNMTEATSVDLLYAETRDLLIRQLQNVEQIDAKAGILGGFAGVIMTGGLTVIPNLPNLSKLTSNVLLIRTFPILVLVGFAATLVSFAFAVWSARIRCYKEVLKPRPAYESWMGQQVYDIKLKLLHNLIDAHEKNDQIIDSKAALFQGSMYTLFLAVLLFMSATTIYASISLL